MLSNYNRNSRNVLTLKEGTVLTPLTSSTPPAKEGAKDVLIDLDTRPEPVFRHTISDLHVQEYYKEILGII
jgi:hypothetical protein